MVEDERIETTVSPFAIREGEIKVFDGKDGYVSINQIIRKINLGQINDLHFEILNIVNKFEFVTSRQIYQLLLEKNFEIKSQDKLTNKSDQLVKSKILTRYYFSSEKGQGAYRVYCLEKMGKYLLNSREIDCNWQPTDNTKTVQMIKKRLAGNQVLLAYKRKVSSFADYVVKPEIIAKSAKKSLKAHGLVKLEKGNMKINLLFEVARRGENWEELFEKRMRLYKDFYNNFVPGDCGFISLPQFILVCEDDLHAVEVFKEVVTKNSFSDKYKIYFTTDLKQNDASLTKSLIEFAVDPATGKYRAFNVDLKILG